MARRRESRARRMHGKRAAAMRARPQVSAGRGNAKLVAGGASHTVTADYYSTGAAISMDFDQNAGSSDDAAGELNDTGAKLGMQGRIKEAMRCFEGVLARFPNHYEANLNMGNCMLDSGKTKRGLEHYARAVRAAPELPQGHFVMGRALRNIGRFDEAAKAFGRALKRDPSILHARIARATCLAAVGRTSDSVEEYDKVLRGGGDADTQSEANYEKGEVLMAENRTAEAMRCYSKAVRMTPDEPGPHAGMAKAYTHLGMYGKAIREYKQVIRLKPGDPRAYANIAACFTNRGKYDRALKYINRALKVDPMYAYGHSIRARVLLMSGGDRDSAMASMQEAVRIDPRFAADPLGSHLQGKKALKEGVW